MSQSVTYEQIVDFFNKKTLQEQPEPKKAKQFWKTLKKMLKKYMKLIYARKDIIAPTSEQWKRILAHHKDQLTKTKLTPILTVRGRRPDNYSIQKNVEKMELAKKMQKWAHKLQEKVDLINDMP